MRPLPVWILAGAAQEPSGALGVVYGVLILLPEFRPGCGQPFYEFFAGGIVRGLSYLRIATSKKLLFLNLDLLPRWISQHHIEPTLLKDFWELQRPVEEAIVPGQRACKFHLRAGVARPEAAAQRGCCDPAWLGLVIPLEECSNP